MSKSKHREAQMIGALKQVEAGRKVEDVAPESVSGKPRPVQESQGQMNKCGTALGGKILSKLTIQRGETRAVSRPGLNQIDEPILLFPRRPTRLIGMAKVGAPELFALPSRRVAVPWTSFRNS